MSNNETASLAEEEYGLTFSNGMLFSPLAATICPGSCDSYKFCGSLEELIIKNIC